MISEARLFQRGDDDKWYFDRTHAGQQKALDLPELNKIYVFSLEGVRALEKWKDKFKKKMTDTKNRGMRGRHWERNVCTMFAYKVG